jgi:hypothetical protein
MSAEPHRNRPRSAAVPRSWSPEQALAAFELIDEIREQIWDRYGPAIQRALRRELHDTDPRQLPLFDDGEPF